MLYSHKQLHFLIQRFLQQSSRTFVRSIASPRSLRNHHQTVTCRRHHPTRRCVPEATFCFHQRHPKPAETLFLAGFLTFLSPRLGRPATPLPRTFPPQHLVVPHASLSTTVRRLPTLSHAPTPLSNVGRHMAGAQHLLSHSSGSPGIKSTRYYVLPIASRVPLPPPPKIHPDKTKHRRMFQPIFPLADKLM